MSKRRTRLVIEKDTVYELDQRCLKKTAHMSEQADNHKKRLSGRRAETGKGQKA